MTRILVIDDERVIRELICEILAHAGYETIDAETAADALELLDDDGIALVVSDIVMPGLTGLELLDEVRARRPSLPVILVTGAGTYENLSQAVTRGADGLVIKPFSHADLQNAVSGALERSRRAERDLRERLLAPAIAAALGNAIESRDGTLHGHCERLAALAARIAEKLRLSHPQIERIRLGAALHDVGKIAIPDRVLLKEGLLNDEERTVMQTHSELGDRLLEPLAFVPDVRAIVRHHHERWDGRGYPDKLAEEQIPLGARIVAVADAVEAMSSTRPYRTALDTATILQELAAGRGAQWDAVLVDIVLDLVESGELIFEADGLRVTSQRDQSGNRNVLLVVDEEEEHAVETAAAIESAADNIMVVRANGVGGATELCRGSRWALAVVSQNLPDGTGLELLQTIKERTPSVPVVMLTGAGSESVAIEAFRAGASDYVVKSNGYLAELGERVRLLLEAA